MPDTHEATHLTHPVAARIFIVETRCRVKVQVQMWGNSLAVRIPKPFAAEVAVREGSELDLTVLDGRLVATPTRRRRKSLGQLLSKVTRANLHGEADAGAAVGREAL
jgi:antitoxin MazE